jgi:hypothetical protein
MVARRSLTQLVDMPVSAITGRVERALTHYAM